jgi:glycosyltransferase involved in cell wall biosynthesis
MNKLPVSVLVASCNEGHILEECLQSLQFCDEIFGVDLESDDNSMELFRKYANKVESFRRVPMIEHVHPHFIHKLKHDWIILIDPDERIMPALAESIKSELEQVPDHICTLRAPMINHFKGKPLKGTMYGGIIYARLLYRRSGITVDDDVHTGIKMKPGFDRKKIRYTSGNYDKHLWCNSWKQLADKHRRYLLGEGQARYNDGKRYRFGDEWKAFLRTFYINFKGLKGYLDGFTGLAISFMQARYEFIAYRRLRAYQRQQ